MDAERRTLMAAAARERVLRAHTGLARARQLVAALSSSGLVRPVVREAV
jgi:hypothetical protein